MSINETLTMMFEPGEVIAIGLLGKDTMQHSFAASIDEASVFVEEEDRSERHEGIYLNLQHHNGQRRSIKKEDVDRYKYLLVDIDRKVKNGLTVEQDRDRNILNGCRPKHAKLPRLPYVPATQEELDQLAAVRDKVRGFMHEKLGVMPGIVAATGNGWHLLYPLDGILPGDKALVGNCLLVLSEKFDSDEGCGAGIDRSTADEPQLVRLYGTWNRKGISTKERPHRQSYILTHEAQAPMAKNALLALALEAPPGTTVSIKDGDFPELDEDFDYNEMLEWVQERLPEDLADLFVEEHSYVQRGVQHVTLAGCVNAGHKHRGDANKTQLIIGKTLGYKCFSDECDNVTIGTFLKNLWELCGEVYPYPIWKKKELGYGLDIAEDVQLAPENDSVLEFKPIKWGCYAKALDNVREGKEIYTDDNGKQRTRKKAKHVVDEDVFQFTLKEVVDPHCKLYFDAYPYVFVAGDRRIYNWANTTDSYEFLSHLHLRLTQPDARLVQENLSLHILTKGEHTRIEKYGCMKGDAVYVNNGRGGMFKITTEEITEIQNGIDGVLMLAPEVKPWPVLAGNEGRINELARQTDKKGGKVSDSPLCRHFTGMFEENTMTTEQYQQLLLLRYLSLFLGNIIDLRPILMSLGEQGSGKSTLWEKIMWLMEGMQYESGTLPTKMRDFVAAVTNSQMQIFDNIDGANFSNPKSDCAGYIDLMCKCSTGGKIPIATLYETNVSREYSLRCDLFFTARTNPFPSHRSDLARRMIVFPVRKPEKDEYVTTEKMKANLLKDSDDMKLETLVRLHYLVKALVANRDKEYAPVSEMHSYENWTMRIADFEGWAEQMVAIWQGCKASYLERVTEDSPLVNVIRRWIGSDPDGNIGRWVRTSEIYKELSERYGRELRDSWRTDAVFGRRLKENYSALRLLGIQSKKLNGSPMYSFQPSGAQVEQSVDAYKDSTPEWRLRHDEEHRISQELAPVYE